MDAGGEQFFDWSVLVPRSIHPLEVAIIEAMEWIGQPLAPSELMHVVDEAGNEKFGLSHVAYHMGRLKEKGGLVVVRRESVRGATKSYYWFAPQQPR